LFALDVAARWRRWTGRGTRWSTAADDELFCIALYQIATVDGWWEAALTAARASADDDLLALFRDFAWTRRSNGAGIVLTGGLADQDLLFLNLIATARRWSVGTWTFGIVGADDDFFLLNFASGRGTAFALATADDEFFAFDFPLSWYLAWRRWPLRPHTPHVDLLSLDLTLTHSRARRCIALIPPNLNLCFSLFSTWSRCSSSLTSPNDKLVPLNLSLPLARPLAWTPLIFPDNHLFLLDLPPRRASGCSIAPHAPRIINVDLTLFPRLSHDKRSRRRPAVVFTEEFRMRSNAAELDVKVLVLAGRAPGTVATVEILLALFVVIGGRIVAAAARHCCWPSSHSLPLRWAVEIC
jgi:hypothetical protein